jgi:uncharacterized BrkB/YihY/UPF0761 family membrane protein
LAIFRRAARAAVDDQITDAAAAIAYYAFLAIPALLLSRITSDVLGTPFPIT